MIAPAPRGPVALAIDLGTSSTRAALFDATGALLPGTLATRPHAPATTPDGGSELDARALAAEVVAVIDEALAAAPGVEVAAVGACSLWHSVLGVDAREVPVTPVYTWADLRARAALPELRARLDLDELYDRTACPTHPSYLPLKLLWLARAQPDAVARVHRWLSPGEYVQLALLGEAVCAEGMASATGLYDQRARTWDAPALEAATVSPDRLAPLVQTGSAAGELRAEYRSRWPALRRAQWVPFIGDGAASNVGSGAVRPGVVALNYGTSAALRTVVTRPLQPPRGLWLYRLDAERLLLGGAVSNAGNVYAWLLATLAFAPEDAEGWLAEMDPGATGLRFTPHLAGERSPGWRPDATGALSGLRLDSSRHEILQAGVEGVLAELFRVYKMLSTAAEVHTLIASGGALRESRALRRNLADALGAPLAVSLEPEPSARGAALLALEAVGALRIADVPVRTSGPSLPDDRRHAAYEAIAFGGDERGAVGIVSTSDEITSRT